MGSGASKTMNIPIVYAERNPQVSSFKFNQKQKLVIPETYHKIKPNYIKIPLMKESQDQGSIKVVHGLVGLRNLGNTCYFNTAIHCLSHTQPLLDYVLSRVHEEEINKSSKNGSKGIVTRCFAQLLFDIWNDNRSIGIADISTQRPINDPKNKLKQYEECIVPSQLLVLVQKYSKRFEIGQQEDCQELLSYLLEMIHEDLNRCKVKIPISLKDYNGQPKDEWAAESWAEHLKVNKSVIVDLFQGQLKSTCKCATCGFQSHKWEPFQFLNLPLQNRTDVPQIQSNNSALKMEPSCSLYDCLDQFQKEELLDGSCQWFCPNCNKHQDSKKSIQIWKLPNILIIHLKRFQYGTKSEKVSTRVDFPVDNLDLSSYCLQQLNPFYTLYAVAQHHGSLHYGHYISACKNRNDNKWYIYNDESVFQVQDIQKMIVNEYAYLLFYQRNTDEIFRQTISNPKGWPHHQISPRTTNNNRQMFIMDHCDEDDTQRGQMDNSPQLVGTSINHKRNKQTSRESTATVLKGSPGLGVGPGPFKLMTNTLDVSELNSSEPQTMVRQLEKDWNIIPSVDKQFQMKTTKLMEANAKGKFDEVRSRQKK